MEFASGTTWSSSVILTVEFLNFLSTSSVPGLSGRVCLSEILHLFSTKTELKEVRDGALQFGKTVHSKFLSILTWLLQKNLVRSYNTFFALIEKNEQKMAEVLAVKGVKDPEKEINILLDFCENFVAKPVDLSTIKSYLAHTGGGTRLREYLQVVNKAIPEILVQYDCAT